MSRNTRGTAHYADMRNRYVPLGTAPVLAPWSPQTNEEGAGLVVSTAAVVELVFTDFSFTASEVTRDLREIRITVRLSRGITTGTPTAGPLSSYIHRIPLEQPSICMSFGIRSYTAESSRLVIEVVKVTSRPRLSRGTHNRRSKNKHNSNHFGNVYDDGSTENDNEYDNDNDDDSHTRRMREVVAEELLGLAIVPLFTQSRRLILRDPVLNVNNVHLHMQLRLRPHADATASTMDGLCDTAGASNARHGHHNNTNTDTPIRHDASSSAAVTGQTARGASESARRSGHADSVVVLGEAEEAHTVSKQHHGTGPHLRSHHHRRTDVASSQKENETRRADGAPTEEPQRHGAGVSSMVPHPLRSNGSRLSNQSMLSTARSPGRFYLAVHIYSAKELPLVTLSEDVYGARLGTATPPPLPPLHAAAERAHTHLSVAETRRLQRPNSFFVVEDIFSGVDNTLANTGPVSDWFVHELRGPGLHDRTAVRYDSQSPEYDYACVLSIPRESVFLRHDRSVHHPYRRTRDATTPSEERQEPADAAQGGVAVSAEAARVNDGCHAEKPCLRELLLTLWHYAPLRVATGAAEAEARPPATTMAGVSSREGSSEEGATSYAQHHRNSHAPPSSSSHPAPSSSSWVMPETSEEAPSSLAPSVSPTSHADHGVMKAQDEMSFWSRSAFIGASTIDLRPLRYLSRLDGYYRVESSNRVPDGCQAARSAAAGQTVGYVRVGVSPL